MTWSTLEDTRRIAAELRLPSRAFIDGAPAAARSGALFETLNPATGAVLATLPLCGADEVDRAFESVPTALPLICFALLLFPACQFLNLSFVF